MKILKLSLYLLLFLSLSGAHSCTNNTQELAAHKIHEDHNSCKSDKDCVLIKSNCCGCNQGGKQEAVLKTQAQEKMDKLLVTCEEFMCIQMISKDPSCKQKAVCRLNSCVLE